MEQKYERVLLRHVRQQQPQARDRGVRPRGRGANKSGTKHEIALGGTLQLIMEGDKVRRSVQVHSS